MEYQNQSNSLKFVQKFGSQLENGVKKALGWASGRVVYFQTEQIVYDVQVDSCWPDTDNPSAFVSVTYCKPDKPGHSNENKLQLKLGELMLLKARYPEIRAILVIGGNKNTWAPYILDAFTYFYDQTIFAWEDNFEEMIEKIKNDPTIVKLKHSTTWSQLSKEWMSKELWTDDPINSSLRLSMWNEMSSIGCEGELPENITNEIFRHCMNAAYQRSVETRNKNGKEWTNYVNNEWGKLWESRSFFNPAEAAIQLSLDSAGFAYKGGLAKDVDVPSLIHHLGGDHVDNTKVSEDFVLFSQRLQQPVFIQSKATGGGKEGHGKNIQNRTKEQLARSLFYRGAIDPNDINKILLREKDFYWIGVLDGNWGVTQRTPLKYLHMLQWAGYDRLVPADSLVNDDLTLNKNNNLINILEELDCIKDSSAYEQNWEQWISQRIKK